MKDIARGASPEDSIKNIEKEFGVSRANAARLVYTETAAISSQATLDSYIKHRVKKYQVISTLDLITSDICRSMDGIGFDVKDYRVGVTANPFHLNCRSDTIPYFNDDK
ncbi:minor capsid protein [Peptoniphilus sp.]|jgi:SPP1 gp7 family putative phage head morphogenesis protein|uniref:minor capsid protein n=1 Tax=Peptoniphilus sp. TaxID=1971214 RepID=UPI003D928EE7